MIPLQKSSITGVQGWESLNEQNILSIITSLLDPAVIVEIGSEFGMSASIFSKFAPSATVFCVEINPEAPFMENIRAVGLGANVIPVIGNSVDVAKRWNRIADDYHCTNKIELLFIDGDHSAVGALMDLNAWVPHVMDGGIVVMHDVNVPTNTLPHEQHIDVKSAFDAWHYAQGDESIDILGYIDSCLVFRKLGSDLC